MVEEVNEKQKIKLLAKIESHYKNESLKGKTFAVWGLAFKPDTDDMREAPSIPIISELHRLGVNLQAYDPEAVETSKYYFDGKVKYVTDAYEALDGAEALLLLTEWREFREPDFNRVKKFLTKHVIFDGRNLYKKPQMNRLGFTHYGIGMT